MESTTQQSLRKKNHNGFNSLKWQDKPLTGFLAGIDFDQILASSDAREIIEAMPIQPLFYGIKQKGLANCSGVLPLLTDEQFSRILDYDSWSDELLVPSRAFDWLFQYYEINPKLLYERYSFLDPEYQTALLAPYIRVYDEEMCEHLSSVARENVIPLPCNKVFYQITTDNKWLQDIIGKLITISAEQNPRYAYALLSHAGCLPPNEAEHQMLQFRRARLEEDGFVSLAEAEQLLRYCNPQSEFEKWAPIRSKARVGVEALPRKHQTSDFLEAVLAQAQADTWDIDRQYELHQKFLFLANSLCSSSRIEPYDYWNLAKVVEQGKALVGVGLDFLSTGNPDVGLKILSQGHPKHLYRVGLSLVDQSRTKVIQSLEATKFFSMNKIQAAYREQKFGLLLEEIENELLPTLGFRNTEFLKGLFNRFPMLPKTMPAGTVMFSPLVNYSQQQQLDRTIQAICGGLSMLHFLGITKLNTSIERYVATLFANQCVNNSLTTLPLAPDKLQPILKSSKQDYQIRQNQFVKSMQHRLLDNDWQRQWPQYTHPAQMDAIVDWFLEELPVADSQNFCKDIFLTSDK